MSVNESLARNCYVPDDRSHIVLDGTLNDEQFALLEKVCPAGLFQRNAEGQAVLNYRGCLECGCCRTIAGPSAFSQWRYPASGCGIALRFG
ncbi:ferredoxin family protein [Mixta theicola]|uniref:Ferredoxin-like protein n=1 Tax=Mixta theicola TaxID=1458355 RepID=A0A2K1Q7N7_9GAMM|nr:ferredoxin family protein [Mixta theicola]PNS11053.1 ferredoxin family protein [Mixta theicola]GLR08398.1 ferredoxin family protein [Mixta theicola]